MRATHVRTTRLQVRLKRSLLGNGFASIVLGTAPIFGVAYWFASSRGGLEVVAIANAVVLAIALLLLWRQVRVFCAVTETELTGNGIFTPLVRVALSDIRSVQLIPTYLGAAPEPVLQLLVTDDAGRRLFRMRGNFWHEKDLRRLAQALPVPVETVTGPFTAHDFLRSYPTAAYWFERRRPLQAVFVAIVILAGVVAATWIMTKLGLPVRFL